MWKTRNTHNRTRNMARKMKYMKNEKRTLWYLNYGEKHWKFQKKENTTVGLGIW